MFKRDFVVLSLYLIQMSNWTKVCMCRDLGFFCFPLRSAAAVLFPLNSVSVWCLWDWRFCLVFHNIRWLNLQTRTCQPESAHLGFLPEPTSPVLSSRPAVHISLSLHHSSSRPNLPPLTWPRLLCCLLTSLLTTSLCLLSFSVRLDSLPADPVLTPLSALLRPSCLVFTASPTYLTVCCVKST